MLLSFSYLNNLMEEFYLENVQLIGESFDGPYSEHDTNFHKSAFSLMKRNNGLFKSPAQSQYFHRSYNNRRNDEEGSILDHTHYKKNYGVDVKPHEGVKQTHGTMNFNPYTTTDGARAGNGLRHVGNIFTFDQHGITNHYKLHYSRIGNSWQTDPTKTEHKWSRPTNLDLSHVKAQAADAEKKKEELTANSKHIGALGDKLKTQMKLHSTRSLGFNDYGSETHMNVLRDNEGNLYHHFGTKLGMGEGDTREIHATVKAHKTDNRTGEKVTLLTRPKVK